MKKNYLISTFLILGIIIVAYLVFIKPKNQQKQTNFPSVSAEVKIGDVAIAVEIADAPDTRAQGLMFRNSLDEGHGMFFIFDSAGYHSFWMRNTLIPLDIVWIADNRIVDIKSNLPPAGNDPFPPTYEPVEPATHILEVNAGTAAKYGWKVGDVVNF